MMVDVLLTKKAYILHISVILKMSITLFFLRKYSCAILENYMYVFFWARLCSFFLLPVCFCTIIQIKMVSEYEVTSCAYKFYLKKQSLLSLTGVLLLKASWDICTFSFQSVSLTLLSWNRSICILLQLYFMLFQLYLLCTFLT